MQPDYMEARLEMASLGCKLCSFFAQKFKLKVLRQHEEKNGSNKLRSVLLPALGVWLLL